MTDGRATPDSVADAMNRIVRSFMEAKTREDAVKAQFMRAFIQAVEKATRS